MHTLLAKSSAVTLSKTCIILHRLGMISGVVTVRTRPASSPYNPSVFGVWQVVVEAIIELTETGKRASLLSSLKKQLPRVKSKLRSAIQAGVEDGWLVKVCVVCAYVTRF